MEKSEKLSIRKRASLWTLMLILKIIEPTEYSHTYEAELKEIKTLLGQL